MMWRIFTTIASTSLFLASASITKSNPDKALASQSQAISEIAQLDLTKHGDKYGRGDRLVKLQERLDLSTEQTQQIETIQQESQTQTNDLRLQLQQAQLQLQSLFSNDASAEELRQQHQQIQELRQQFSDVRFETRLQIREVLTPEQRTQLATYSHHGWWGDRHNGWGRDEWEDN